MTEPDGTWPVDERCMGAQPPHRGRGVAGIGPRRPADCRRFEITRLVREEVEALFDRLEDQPEDLAVALDELFAEIDCFRYGPL